MSFKPTATIPQRIKALDALVDTLKADTKPILLGPWRSEVGFEVLYWLPFLRRLASRVPDFDKRAVVVTRGGLAPFYAPVAAQGYDLYALRSVTELRRENLHDQLHTKAQKQMQPTAWDEDVLDDVRAEMGFAFGAPYHTVHPAWMYWTCEPFWNEDAGLKHLTNLCDFAPLKKPTVGEGLPPRYVAVKFYGRATFPYPDPQVAEFVQRTVTTISQQTEVVLLTSSSEHDDHADIICAGPRIHALPVPEDPTQNLLLQASVLAHATAFIGTYGGVAQFALRMGVPSVSFYQHFNGTAHAHLALSSWLSTVTNTPFLAGSIDDAHLWRQVVGGVTVQAKEMVAG